MKLSLKIKLILSFILLISIPLAVLGTISYNMAYNSLQSTIEQQLKDRVGQAAESIERTVSSIEKQLAVISINESLIKTIKSNGAEGKEEAFSYLELLQKNDSSLIESLVLADASGKVLLTNDNQNPDINISDREYFTKVIGGQTAISGALKSKATGNTIIAVATPVKSDGTIIGVVVAAIKFENITEHVSEIKIGKTGYAFLIDKTGLLVQHPNPDKIFKENLSDTSSTELKGIITKMKAGEADSGFYNYEGVYKFVSYVPVVNWSIAITVNVKDYMSAAFAIRTNTILVFSISMVVAIMIAYFITIFSIIKPVRKLQALMGKAGAGDLTVKSDIETKDEIQALGDSFNMMINHQEQIVKRVRIGAKELASASDEMAASSEQISSATQQITTSIQEVAKDAAKQNESIVDTSQVLVQLSSLVQLAQNKASSAKHNSDSTMKTANIGREKLRETVDAIDTISRSTNETVVVLHVLNDLSQKVGGIITTINGIAEQTNLLALNAAIEAARAGEHGRGFAVVADEVRKLSEQSNQGANEIERLVKEMIQQTEKAVKSIEQGKTEVEKGVEVAGYTDATFKDIINAVELIAKSVEEIVDITKDEVATSDQIVKLIDTVASITETTSANSQEVAAGAQEQAASIETLASTAEETSAMANELENLVSKFVIRSEEN